MANTGASERRGRGPLAIAAVLDKVTRPLGRRRGLADARLMAEWAAVVGPQLAAESLPERLVRRRDGAGGTLTIRVDGPMALELQHLAPLVIERLNAYFGYRAIERIVLRQAPVPRPTGEARPRRPAPAAGHPAPGLERVADPELRRALAALGRFVLAPAGELPRDDDRMSAL